MPGEDEAKETEDGKDESTAEKPVPEPEKTGHWAPFGSPRLVAFSRDSQEVRDPGREETETPTERGGGVFPAESPAGQPSCQSKAAGSVAGSGGAAGTVAWSHLIHPYGGEQNTGCSSQPLWIPLHQMHRGARECQKKRLPSGQWMETCCVEGKVPWGEATEP